MTPVSPGAAAAGEDIATSPLTVSTAASSAANTAVTRARERSNRAAGRASSGIVIHFEHRVIGSVRPIDRLTVADRRDFSSPGAAPRSRRLEADAGELGDEHREPADDA